ncbi:LysR family cys regulon transcriptional activator [Ancylobacter aquaticus]|uniref:LysR family cys regulon transcriptional activator n=1 Tax=Ancylobacter aquaticus TaxID=100 RepID=A0A4R1HCF6_ANCAQ|nr:LysR substrate-binding domain-containing protein [Ancylobacter aquaticus]TCK19697.1 LysR family cys regulon transcriptional activator [Ancylobacter aquaticus]
MRLQQLRYVLEIARQGNHLSAAAEALHTSQPGVSRQVQMLESELGFPIFQRTRNRIIGLTEPGEQVLEIAKRVVGDLGTLRILKDDVSAISRGTLVIATTHTQAKYVLPPVVSSFLKNFPDVQIVLKQGDPEGICSLVDAGEADIAIGTETAREFPNLVGLPCFELTRSVVAKVGHPILSAEHLTLEEVAQYPIITYDPRFAGETLHRRRWKVLGAFEQAGLEPRIVLSAIDADVCKTYVLMGLGIAIFASVSFDEKADVGLGIRDARHLFESSMTYLKLRSNAYLRPYTLEFIRRLAPHLTPDIVREALQNRGRGPTVQG